MKKLFALFVLVVGMITSTFSQDTIVYHYGAESVVVSPGDSLNNIVFSQTVDGFTRLQDMNGMVQYSSNGKSFWLKNIRLDEDTLANTIKILSAIVVADPTLVAVVIKPIDGDADSPSLGIKTIFIFLIISVLLVGSYLAVRFVLRPSKKRIE